MVSSSKHDLRHAQHGRLPCRQFEGRSSQSCRVDTQVCRACKFEILGVRRDCLLGRFWGNRKGLDPLGLPRLAAGQAQGRCRADDARVRLASALYRTAKRWSRMLKHRCY